MDSRRIERLAIGAVTCLIAFQSQLFAAGLREEAVRYREEGYALQQREDFSGALAAYQKAGELDPSYAVPHNDAGVIYERQGNLDAAKQAYQRALGIDPDYVEAHTNMALLAERMNDTTAATYHWLKRYQLGSSEDPWTARAGERLVALGVLTQQSLKGEMAGRRQLVEQAFATYQQELRDYESVTKRWRVAEPTR